MTDSDPGEGGVSVCGFGDGGLLWGYTGDGDGGVGTGDGGVGTGASDLKSLREVSEGRSVA